VAPIAPPNGLDLQAGEAVTDRDKLISYDLAIWCVGARPDASYLRPHFADALDAAGHIRVEPSLRVVGVPNVFALGDVADFREKGGIWAQFQAKVCVDNLKRLLADPATARLKHYRRPLRATTMVVTLGRKNGVMDLPFGRFRAGWLARAVKARDMLVTRYRKGIGLVPARKMPDDGPDLEGAS
jgi:NADH dehydrogenase FAD-containing subunit